MYTKDNERMTQANVNAEHRCNLIRIFGLL